MRKLIVRQLSHVSVTVRPISSIAKVQRLSYPEFGPEASRESSVQVSLDLLRRCSKVHVSLTVRLLSAVEMRQDS